MKPQGIIAMRRNGRLVLMLVMVPLTLSVSGCFERSPTGAAQATLDAVKPHVRPCAGALAGESMPDARRECLPVVARLVE